MPFSTVNLHYAAILAVNLHYAAIFSVNIHHSAIFAVCRQPPPHRSPPSSPPTSTTPFSSSPYIYSILKLVRGSYTILMVKNGDMYQIFVTFTYELEMGQWSKLPGDLLDIVEGHLLLYRDKVRVRAVCASWNSHLPKLPNQQVRQLPWLLQAFDKGAEATHGLFNPFEKKFYHLDLPEAKGKLFKGSSHGWVVTIEDITSSHPADMYLINPLTRARIQLPPRSAFPDVKDYHPNKVGDEYTLFCEDDVDFFVTDLDHLTLLLDKVVLSSNPSSEDCVVVAIYGESGRLAFCKCNDDKWTRLDLPAPYASYLFEDVKFYQQKLYAVRSCGELVVIEDIGPNPKVTRIVAPNPSYPLCAPVYLVESSDGDLIMLDRSIRVQHGENCFSIVQTVDFGIYKLDLSSSSWREVESIGEDMYFLGYNSSVSISSREFPGLKGNCIYYTEGPESFGAKKQKHEDSDIGVFKLDEEIFDELPGFKCESKKLNGEMNYQIGEMQAVFQNYQVDRWWRPSCRGPFSPLSPSHSRPKLVADLLSSHLRRFDSASSVFYFSHSRPGLVVDLLFDAILSLMRNIMTKEKDIDR
ncbi:hypothetical protein LguiA_018037 [Lonicera macranthoides]